MKLKEFRKQYGYTLQEISDVTNLSVSLLSKLENGVSGFTDKTIEALSVFENLGVKIDVDKQPLRHMTTKYLKEIDDLKKENKKLLKNIKKLKQTVNEFVEFKESIYNLIEGTHYVVPRNKEKKV